MTDTNTLAPTDDLQKRCAEIIGWCRTGVLVGDTLRSHAESKWPGDIHNLQMAERATENEALCFIAKWGAPAPASQPFAYEFSRSNGDGTHSEHIERGRLQEVAPGRWEHSGLPRGALADKPIKALYTTPQTQPAAVPASGPVGFDHKTAANFLNGKTVTDEEVRQFVAHSRWAHDDRDWLRNTIADLHREIAQRDAEISLLKTSLLDAESPTQAAQAQGEVMTQDEMIEECIIACESLKIEYAEIAASPLVTAQGADIYRAMSAGANNCMVALRELQAQYLTGITMPADPAQRTLKGVEDD